MDLDPLPTRRDLIEMALRAAALPGAALFFDPWLRAGQNHNHAPLRTPPPQPDHLRDYQPQFFQPADFQALQAFTEILIPTDGTPGARDAHCAHYIDFVLQASGEMPQTQSAWRHALEELNRLGFHTADPARQLALVSEMSKPESDPQVHHPAFAAYRLIKQQTAFAFYTSRAGMIECLDYKGNSYNLSFPACNHPEHQVV